MRRVSASVLALAVVVTLALRFWLNMADTGNTLPQALWVNYRFFTIWTVTLIGVLSLWIVVTGRVWQRGAGGLLLAIALVAIVYHALLAKFNDYTGLDAFVDFMLHTFIPIGFALHWALLEAKDRLSLRDTPYWLAYPAVYCVYAILRAQADGIYPYFFLNIDKLGIGGVALYVIGLMFVCFLGAALILLAARWSMRRGSVAP